RQGDEQWLTRSTNSLRQLVLVFGSLRESSVSEEHPESLPLRPEDRVRRSEERDESVRRERDDVGEEYDPLHALTGEPSGRRVRSGRSQFVQCARSSVGRVETRRVQLPLLLARSNDRRGLHVLGQTGR